MLEGCPIFVLVEKDEVGDISNLTDKLSRELNRLIAEPSLHDRISEHFLNENELVCTITEGMGCHPERNSFSEL